MAAVLFGLSCGTAPAASTRSPELVQLLECLSGQFSERTQAFTLSVDSYAPDGRLQHSVRTRVTLAGAEGPGPRDLHLRALYPPDLAGSSYLVRHRDGETRDIWFHMADRAQTVRLAPDSPARLFGTELDLGLLNEVLAAFGQGSISSGGPVTGPRGPALKLYLSLPADNSAAAFDMAVLRVGREPCLPYAVVLERDLRPRYAFQVPPAAWQTGPGGAHYPSVVRMRDSDSGGEMEFRISDFTLLDAIPRRRFDPRRFMD